MGINTEGVNQTIFVDTPGLHKSTDSEKAINRYMNRAASSTINDVDVVVFVVERGKWTEEDDWVLQQLSHAECPVVLVINKVDQIKDKATLLPFLETCAAKMDFAAIIPLSALNDANLDPLTTCLNQYLPVQQHLFPDDQITDRSSRFMASELVREKIMRQLGDEIPYAMTVEIEQFKDSGKSLHIHALILVEREGQKRIVIGSKGSRLRLIGQEARLDMEAMFERKVMLKLWVKVKSGWSDDERALRSLGYGESD
jgi:GTP-binding protein Era